MFNPDGCFCCLPPEDPCTVSGCTFLSDEMSDSEINPYWTQVVASSGAVGNGSYTVTNAQDNDVGNDAPSRRVTLITDSATTTSDNVYLVCWKKNSTHNPSTQCPVTNITFCVESKRVSESDGQVRFFLRQNNGTYVTKTGSAIGVNWKRATGTFVQSDFEELSSGAQPNFTATGTAIEFGYGLKIAVNAGDEPFSDVWFDNLCVKLTKNCPPTLVCHDNSQGPSTYYDQCVDNGWSPTVALEKIYTFSGSPVAATPGTTVASVANANGYVQSIKIQADTSGTFGRYYYSAVRTGITIDPSTFSGGAGCQQISSLYCCFALYVENIPSATNHQTAVLLYQNGCYYGESRVVDFSLRQNYTAGWKAAAQAIVAGVVPARLEQIGGFQIPIKDDSATAVPFNANLPFEIAIYTRLSTNTNQSTPSGLFTYYIDNICVKATYGGCFTGTDYELSLSGLSVVESHTPPTCPSSWAAVATEFTSVLSSTIMLTSAPQIGSNCYWRYIYTSTINPLYKLSVYLYHNSSGTGDWGLGGQFSGLGGGGWESLAMSSTQPFDCTQTLNLTTSTPPDAGTCIRFEPTGSVTATATPT